MIQFFLPPKRDVETSKICVDLYPETWGNDSSWIMIIPGFVCFAGFVSWMILSTTWDDHIII